MNQGIWQAQSDQIPRWLVAEEGVIDQEQLQILRHIQYVRIVVFGTRQQRMKKTQAVVQTFLLGRDGSVSTHSLKEPCSESSPPDRQVWPNSALI